MNSNTLYANLAIISPSSRWTRVNKQNTLDLTQNLDVYEGLEYLIRVSAENDAGRGEPCATIGPLLAKAPHGELLCV